MKLQLSVCLWALSGLVASVPLERRDFTSDTQNGLVANACKGVTLIMARGTWETGNVGTGVGPPLATALAPLLKQDLAVQGVPYPANATGFMEGGDPTGSANMAALVVQAWALCPSTKVVMAGYSQGGQLVHNAAAILGASMMAKVSNVVIFGDPDDGKVIKGIAASKVKVYCHTGDLICSGLPIIDSQHLNYGPDATASATWVAANL